MPSEKHTSITEISEESDVSMSDAESELSEASPSSMEELYTSEDMFARMMRVVQTLDHILEQDTPRIKPKASMDVDKLVEQGVSTLEAIQQAMQLFQKLDTSTAKEEALWQILVNDLEVNQKAANAKRFVDMGLWHRVEQINHIAMKQAKAQETFQDLPAEERERRWTEECERRFHEYYMTQLTETFGDDLDRIRQGEELDESRLNILIDALETGVGSFSLLEKELTLNYADPAQDMMQN